MIISKSQKFAFIKGRKVAGTSVEVGLSSLCTTDDILTPISPIDELLRLQTTGRFAQNYGADAKKLKRYRTTLLASDNTDNLNWSDIRKPRGRYGGHMSFKDMEQTFGGFSPDWTIIAITRCPYEQALSRIKHSATKEPCNNAPANHLTPAAICFSRPKNDSSNAHQSNPSAPTSASTKTQRNSCAPAFTCATND